MDLHRFGRKIPLPSTREIKHELRMMAAADAIRLASTHVAVTEVIAELARANGLSQDQSQTLLARFDLAPSGLVPSGLVPSGLAPQEAATAGDVAPAPTDIATDAIDKMDRDIAKDTKAGKAARPAESPKHRAPPAS